MLKTILGQRYKQFTSLIVLLTILCCTACVTKKVVQTKPTEKAVLPMHCVDSSYVADSSIQLSPKKIISLFGAKQFTPRGTVFTKLRVEECNKDKFYKFSSVGAYLPIVQADTLYLKQLVKLPGGAKYDYEELCVLKHKLWFSHDSLQLKIVLDNEFPSYSNAQILDIFEEYQKLEIQYNEKTELLMDKLFVSALSGNALAATTFKNFEAKFTALNGNHRLRYNELNSLLKQYLQAK